MHPATPIDGKLWLPPDTETAIRLLLKLCRFHGESAKATYCGESFVAHHVARATIAGDAVAEIDAIELEL